MKWKGNDLVESCEASLNQFQKKKSLLKDYKNIAKMAILI
jgi:hypothetical protein